MTSPARAHWIVRVARGASLPAADALDVPSGLSDTDAWKAVMEGCGIDEARLAAAVAEWFRLEVADLPGADALATSFLPAEVARRFNVFPLEEQERHLVVATANPCDAQAEQQVGFASGRSTIFRIAPPERIADAVGATYSPEQPAPPPPISLEVKPDPRLKVLKEEPAPSNPEIEVDGDESGPIVELANMILKDAVAKSASDIHLQPVPSGGVIRLRIDGVLRSGITVPLPVLGRVISRIKILSRLDISDKMRPQDGRARLRINDHTYDLRVSTVPVRGGEKAVIRILDPEQSGALDESGLPLREVARLRRVLGNRDGILVVTGPTGSGKTTTMYAALREIATADVNIMTVEDPVEYELPGLTQIQVDAKQGVTFHTALKAILRQDPDVIFVGEIRDESTAEMAAQASLTGHLVLATVHANDAVGAVRRFLDLGLEAGTISEVLRGALAQRLLRTLCRSCTRPVGDQLDAAETKLTERYGTRPTMRAVGCQECGDSGYLGRRPVAEFILPTAALRRLVAKEAGHHELLAQARADGMTSLLEGALDLVADGITTLAEVERVIGEEVGKQPAPPAPRPSAPEERVEPVDTPAPAPAPPPTAAGPPAASPPPPFMPPARKRPAPSAAKPAPAPAASAAAPRLLVVDDDEETCVLIRSVMGGRGWDVVEASDGGGALLQIGRGNLALVVLDLGLPDIDGLGVLRAIRRSGDTAHLPVIVLTGKTDRESERQLLLAGADDYIRKPLDPVILAMRAQALVRRGQAPGEPSAS